MDDDTAEIVPCRIMTLPDELVIPAARTAVAIYPGNALPAIAHAILPPQEVAVLTSNYWGAKPRTLSVQFLDNPTAAFRRMFLEAANSWDCCITFAETASDGEVRLSRNQAGYWSYLGTDILHVPANEPTMNLQGFTEHTRNSEWLRVPPHEVGHTLGFPHEHLRRYFVERIDRAKAYAYYLKFMGWGADLVNVNVLTPQEEKALLRPTSPDETSIMTYEIPGAITTDGRPIPGGARINANDLAYADLIYPVEKKGPTPPGPPVEPTSAVALVLAEINARRQDAGLPALAADAKLEALAGGWAATMAATGNFTHGDWSGRINSVYPNRTAGEIIASGQTSAAQAVSDWMTSPGHKAHMLGPYTLAGCGVAGRYWVADFVDGAPDTSAPPVEPPKPKPPVEPPAPPETKEYGPYELRIGPESDKFRILPGVSILFRIKVSRKGLYVAATRGKPDLKMELLDAKRNVLARDDDSGTGPNPMIAKTLAKGTYYLRIRGADPEATGLFRARVVSV